MINNQYEDLIEALERVVSDIVNDERAGKLHDSIENAIDVLRTCGVDVTGLEKAEEGRWCIFWWRMLSECGKGTNRTHDLPWAL